MTTYAGYDLATTATMAFDELFPPSSPDDDGCSTPKRTHDPSHPPPLTPVSPCHSNASSACPSITGNLSDVEDLYHVDPRILGTGHHGSVRRCVDRRTGRKCAVKSVIKGDPSVHWSGLAREIHLLGGMTHRGVVELVDVHEDEEYLHIVTDVCEGGELFDRIVEKSGDASNPHPCLAEDDAASIVYQILEAVKYLHDRGVVHRDLKPENILFETADANSSVKIIDFGLSREHRPGDRPMTTVVGTPYYIAPEVLRRRYDRKCDLWSVGVVAYLLLCGYPPFNGSDNAEVHAAVLRGRYLFPSREWKNVSNDARDFVRSLLQRDPRRRMSAGEALSHPWMARVAERRGEVEATETVEERQDHSSIEVVFRGMCARDAILCCDDVARESLQIPLLE